MVPQIWARSAVKLIWWNVFENVWHSHRQRRHGPTYHEKPLADLQLPVEPVKLVHIGLEFCSWRGSAILFSCKGHFYQENVNLSWNLAKGEPQPKHRAPQIPILISHFLDNFFKINFLLQGLNNCSNGDCAIFRQAWFILPANAMRIWCEFDVTTPLSLRYSQESRVQLNSARILLQICDVNIPIAIAFAFAESMNGALLNHLNLRSVCICIVVCLFLLFPFVPSIAYFYLLFFFFSALWAHNNK